MQCKYQYSVCGNAMPNVTDTIEMIFSACNTIMQRYNGLLLLNKCVYSKWYKIQMIWYILFSINMIYSIDYYYCAVLCYWYSMQYYSIIIISIVY